MKKIIALIIAIVPVLTFGQLSTDKNYVHTTSYNVPVQEGQQGMVSAEDKIESTTYYDGMGRPKQSIGLYQGGNAESIVKQYVYDPVGRQAKNYLPYAETDANPLHHYQFNEDALVDNHAFYNTTSYENTTNPYTETVFERSSLGRPIEMASQGEDWKLALGHTVKLEYRSNVLNEVKNFSVQYTDDLGEETALIYDGFYYSENTLFKTIVKDENWEAGQTHPADHTTEQFKDKMGRLLLTRTYDQGESYDTHYVYDKLGNLTYVIPPLASDQIAGETSRQTLLVNYPWVNMVKVDKDFANLYNEKLATYENAEILNADLSNEYDGSGGFTVSTVADSDLLTLSVSFSANQDLELKTGQIASLKDFGDFKDTELGRIKSTGYDYVFLIEKNAIVVQGSGKVSNINQTFNSNTKLTYSENYPWTQLFDVDKDFADNYEAQLASYPNSDILNVTIPNQYDGQGGLNISVDENDIITVNISSSNTTGLKLKKGLVIPLNIKRRLQDMPLGTVSGANYSYTFEVKENSLYITGDEGTVTNMIAFFRPPPPPETIIDQDVVEGLCYIYHYDNRNRTMEMKVPGRGWEYVVYDKLNRPILTQDAKQRLDNKWNYIKYDAFGRTVYSGIYTYRPIGREDNSGRKELQQLVDSQTNPVWYESKQQTVSSLNIVYSNDAFPNVSNRMEVLTVNYYDTYDGFNVPAIQLVTGAIIYDETITGNTKSLATASSVKVLGTNDWIHYVTYYDDRARPIYAASKNEYLNTVDIVKNDLDFSGKLIESEKSHSIDTNFPIVTVDAYTYDHAGRLLTQVQTIGNNTPELIVNMTYDELGRVKNKKVGGTVAANAEDSNGLQTVDYDFNIRGWLKAINEGNTNNGDVFGFKLNYNDTELTGSTALFNGNISETHFVNAADDKMRSYGYQYDALNRLKKADYHGNHIVEGLTDMEDYSLSNVDYDKNGNILALKRMGLVGAITDTPTEVDVIDQLTYTYAPTSNQLISVSDDVAGADGFKENNASATREAYQYDINGNLVKDGNKGISNIEYNYLDLPTKITFYNDDPTNPNAGVIEYVYDAMGTKLKKSNKRSNESSSAAVYYAGNMVYEQGSGQSAKRLQFIGNSEGYAEPDGQGGYDYIYQYKDHLGNVRLSYSDIDGDYQSLINSGFYEDYEGWSFAGGAANGSIEIDNDRLKVNVKNQYNGVYFDIEEDLTPGDVITVKVDVDKGSTDKIRMYLVERDIDGNHLGYFEVNYDVFSDQHIITHTIVDGSFLRLKVDKSNTSGDVGEDTYFFIDNVTANTGELEIVQAKNYYPFGMDHQYGNASPMSVINGRQHKFKFNGQEHDVSFGLNVTEMTFRQFDMALGRFHGIDKLAAYSYNITPYHFGANNPIYYADPSGLKQVAPGEWQDVINMAYTALNSSNDNLLSIFNSTYGANTVTGFYGEAVFFDGLPTLVPGGGGSGSLGANPMFPGTSGLQLLSGANIVSNNIERNNGVVFNDRSISLNGYNGVDDYSNARKTLDVTEFGLDILEVRQLHLSKNLTYNYGTVHKSANELASQARVWHRSVAKNAGRLGVGAQIISGSIDIIDGVQKDGGQFGQNAQSATAGFIGSLSGGWAGAQAGAAIGAIFGPAGVIVGGLVGGLVGSNVGENVGASAVDYYYNKN